MIHQRAIFLLATSLGGCVAAGQPPAPVSLSGMTEWRLIELDGHATVSQSVVTLSLDMDRKKISGSGGCNQFFANFRDDQDPLRIGPVGRTKRYCKLPDGVMAQESRYIRVLQGIDVLQLDGEILSASGPYGKLRYQPLVRAAE